MHGLGYNPDGTLLAAISVTTNAVTIIETATNRVRGTVYVGRAPHEGFFTPDGRELWVAVRGENYVSVIDPVALRPDGTAEAAAQLSFFEGGFSRVVLVPAGAVPSGASISVSDVPVMHVAMAKHCVLH